MITSKRSIPPECGIAWRASPGGLPGNFMIYGSMRRPRLGRPVSWPVPAAVGSQVLADRTDKLT
jgi:hypothetical protein